MDNKLSFKGFKESKLQGLCLVDNTCYTNIFPAIVSNGIFDEVNAKLKVSKRTSAHHKTEVNHLISGKLICGKCGGLMMGVCGKGKIGKITITTNALQRKNK